MPEEASRHDLFAVLDDLDHHELVEFLEQLQNAVDAAELRNDQLADRITKLETDRETLRARLEAARAELSTIKSSPLGKVASRFTTSASRGTNVSSADVAPGRPLHENRGLVVATIFDEISDASWSPEFTNIRLSRRTWREQIEESSPDLLLVESAFNGVDGSWMRRVAHFGNPHPDITELVHVCRDLGIPTVFWNKEDPINYPWFIGAASAFDQVFTVDADQVPRYEQDLGHSRVRMLPFAAQPTLHYPPSSDAERTGSVGFAGSYYARKHAERRDQMDMLLIPALEFGLDIYDRMDRPDDVRFSWPDQFRPHIVGSVPYVEMGDVYRRYKVFLNVNTVTDSPTMCARRVFELAATGTPIVSGPSKAIESMAPPSVAAIAHSAGAARGALKDLLVDADRRKQASIVGPQWIAESHTYGHRLETILGAI